MAAFPITNAALEDALFSQDPETLRAYLDGLERYLVKSGLTGIDKHATRLKHQLRYAVSRLIKSFDSIGLNAVLSRLNLRPPLVRVLTEAISGSEATITELVIQRYGEDACLALFLASPFMSPLPNDAANRSIFLRFLGQAGPTARAMWASPLLAKASLRDYRDLRSLMGGIPPSEFYAIAENAARSGHLTELMELKLDGFDFRLSASSQDDVLTAALARGSVPVLDFLWDAGFRPEHTTNNVIGASIKGEYPVALRWLLSHGFQLHGTQADLLIHLAQTRCPQEPFLRTLAAKFEFSYGEVRGGIVSAALHATTCWYGNARSILTAWANVFAAYAPMLSREDPSAIGVPNKLISDWREVFAPYRDKLL
jgi:hypothetical protein